MGRLPYIYSVVSFSLEKIRSAPQILNIWKQRGTIYAGTNLRLYCIVSSWKDFKPKIRWYFSERFFQNENKLGTLINQTLCKSYLETSPNSTSWSHKWTLFLNLKDVSVADSGSYSCQAENYDETDQRHTYLKVTTRPITSSPTGKKRLSKVCWGKGIISYDRKLLEDSLLKVLGSDREWIDSTEVPKFSGRYGSPTVRVMVSCMVGCRTGELLF